MILNTWLKPTGDIPSIKAVAVGLAGQRAVESAELAARGVTAPPDALDFALENLSRIGGRAPDAFLNSTGWARTGRQTAT